MLICGCPFTVNMVWCCCICVLVLCCVHNQCHMLWLWKPPPSMLEGIVVPIVRAQLHNLRNIFMLAVMHRQAKIFSLIHCLDVKDMLIITLKFGAFYSI